MDKQANRIVELTRVAFEHLVGEDCEQDQENDGTDQPGDERRAQSRKHGWSIRLRVEPHDSKSKAMVPSLKQRSTQDHAALSLGVVTSCGRIVQGLGYGGVGFHMGLGFGDGVGKRCRDVQVFGAADHLRGLGGIFVVVPDSHDDLERRIRPAQAAKDAVGAGHGDGRHSGEKNEIGLLFADGSDGFVDALDGNAGGVESSLIENLGEHGGDEVVGAVADGDDDDIREQGSRESGLGMESLCRALSALASAAIAGAISFLSSAARKPSSSTISEVLVRMKLHGGFFELSFLPLHLNQRERGDEDGVVDGGEGFGFEACLKDVGGFAFVVGEHALVEGGVRRNDGLIAEQDGEKFKRRNVAAHHHEADGERDGEDEADRSPDKCPESGGDEDGESGEAGVFAVDMGLDVVGSDDFKQDEDAEDFSGVAPSRKDREREHGGRERGDRRSDVRHEAAEKGECAEEKPVRKSDEVERNADKCAVHDVDGDLEKEVARDAPAGVAHGLGHARQVATRPRDE